MSRGSIIGIVISNCTRTLLYDFLCNQPGTSTFYFVHFKSNRTCYVFNCLLFMIIGYYTNGL